MTEEEIHIRPVAGRIGAEIGGVSLANELTEESVATIRGAIVRHKVAFFREQFGLNDELQVKFAQRLGAITTAHPTAAASVTNKSILPVDSMQGGRANQWHTDVSFLERFPAFSVLRAVTLPPHGGDTIWANTAAAYSDLRPEIRQLADRLWALHSNENFGGAGTYKPADVSRRMRFETIHPVVTVHPESGEHALLLGGFVRAIVDSSSAESIALCQILQDHIVAPENTVRWSWRLGDVAIWDNRATQHYAVDDYGDVLRVMRRVTVAGSTPVSVAGTPSKSIQGDASSYYAA